MSAVLVTDAAPNTDAWHAARRDGIGASEIAAVVGLSPFESAFSLWHRKKGNIPGADPSNPLFYWGHALEPLVAQKFSELHPEYQIEPFGTYRHSDRAWQFANIDRSLHRVEDGFSVLEIKTTRYGDGWGPSGSTEIPLHVRCQVMQQMDVFSAPYAWVAVLIGGNDYREYRIEFDETDAAALRDAGAAFWASLQTDDEPPLDYSDSTYEAVRNLHPEIDPDAEHEIPLDLWEQYVLLSERIDAFTTELKALKAQILHAAGSARLITADKQPVLRRQMSSAGTPYLKEIA